MTKYDTRTGAQVVQKLNGLTYSMFFHNWSDDGLFLAVDHVNSKIDIYDESISVKGSATGLPGVWSAFYYRDTNLLMPPGHWSIFGDSSARLRYRNIESPTSTDLKTITFANRTQTTTQITKINGVYETEFVLVGFVDYYIFFVNVAQAPDGASNAVIL